MRKHLLTAALLVWLVAPPAGAQSDEEISSGEAPEGSAEVAQPTAEPGTGSRRETANTRHTVEKGDTLWDLSQRFLGSPWYWPKVWSYNPEIANPHWIYPGNLVRFYQGGEDVPTQVEVGQEVADVDEGGLVGDDADRVVIDGPLGYKPRPTQTLALPGFVTPSEVEGAGRIVGSFAEVVMLSFPDVLYVRFDKQRAKVGETYVVFRHGPELLHPVTKEPVGFYTVILGEVRVTRVDRDIAVAQIVRQFEDIQRTDLIGPSGESLLRKVAARPADRDVQGGVVVSGTTVFQLMFAEHSTVIIDRGSDHGVKTGNVFQLFRQHDALPETVVLNPTIVDEGMPREDVGQCIAFEVKSKATVCLLTRSLRDVVRGDRADIRANGRRASR